MPVCTQAATWCRGRTIDVTTIQQYIASGACQRDAQCSLNFVFSAARRRRRSGTGTAN